MMPFHIDLPPIYRGCDYQDIILRWKNPDGDPMSLEGWTPYCATKNFNLNATVKNVAAGVTTISLSRFETEDLRLGMEQWDWIWLNNFSTEISPPHLAGRVEVKEPLASLERPL